FLRFYPLLSPALARAGTVGKPTLSSIRQPAVYPRRYPVMRPTPSSLASALRAFLTDYLPRQRALSPHTLHSYRDSLKLLLQFVAGKKADPGQLTMDHLTYKPAMPSFLHLTAR